MSVTGRSGQAAAARPAGAQVSVLSGALIVSRDGAPIALNSALQQHLLIELVAAMGSSIPRADLIERLWPGQRPADADNLLSTHVGRLRRLLDADRSGAPSLIPRSARGYRLDPERLTVDLAQLREALHDVRVPTPSEHAWDAAYDMLDALRAPIGRDDRLHALLEEAWRLGRRLCGEVIESGPEPRRWARLERYLEAAHERAPFDEQVAAWWLTCLARSGRTGEALGHYPRIVRLLREELGSQPGRELQIVHQELLAAAAGADPEPTPGAGSAPVPAPMSDPPLVREFAAGSLPAPPLDFAARAEALARFHSLAAGPRPQHGARVIVVSGPAGVGKSTVAHVGAAQLAPDHPDGCVYLDFAAADRLLDPADVVAVLLAGLGEDPTTGPADRASRLRRWRARAAGKRLLVVLDNIGPHDPIAELLPNAPESLVVVTCRSYHQDLLGAPVLDLAHLTVSEVRELLAAGLGSDSQLSARAAPEGLERELGALHELTEGHPIAVRTCAQLLVSHPGWTLRRLLERLTDLERRFDVFSPVDRGLAAVFAAATQNLPDAARDALAATGLLGLPQIEPWMVALILDVSVDQAWDALDDLAAARLIDDRSGADESEGPAFSVSSLLRTYAGRRWRDRGVDAAVGSVGRYVGALIAALGARLGRPSDPPVAAATAAAIARLPESTLVSAVELASRHGLIAECATLARLLGATLFADRNSFEAWRHTHDHAFGHVLAAGPSAAAAELALSRARLHLAREQFVDAEHVLAQAAQLATDCAATSVLAEVQVLRATLWAETHRCRAALEILAGWPGVVRSEERRIQAEGLRQRAAVRRDLGDLSGARADADAAYELFVLAGDQNGVGLAMRSIGLNHLAVGEPEAALRCGLAAEDALWSVGSRLLAQYAVQLGAKARFRMGGIVEPSAPLAVAREVCMELHDDFGHALMLRTLGEEALVLRDLPAAYQYLEWSLKMWQELDLPAWQARTLRDLARCLFRQGESGQARTARAAALQIFDRLGLREAVEMRSHPA